MLNSYLSALLLLLFVSDASTWSVKVPHLLSLSSTFTTTSLSSPPWVDDRLMFAFIVNATVVVALVSMFAIVFSMLIQCSEQLSTQLQSFCILFKSEIKSRVRIMIENVNEVKRLKDSNRDTERTLAFVDKTKWKRE